MSVKHSLPHVKMEGHVTIKLEASPVLAHATTRGVDVKKSMKFAKQSLLQPKVMEVKSPGNLDHALVVHK